jgi:hemerythrin
MNKLQWTDSLSVGIDLIDRQHKQWIDHFNHAADAVATQQSAMHITKTLGFLIDYTETHFATEEKHMAANNYGGLDEHRAKHDELRRTLADLVQDFEEEGVTYKLADATDTFLGNWLIKHIQSVDMKFGAFVKKEGIILADET